MTPQAQGPTIPKYFTWPVLARVEAEVALNYLGPVPVCISLGVILVHLLHKVLPVDELVPVPHPLVTVLQILHLHHHLTEKQKINRDLPQHFHAGEYLTHRILNLEGNNSQCVLCAGNIVSEIHCPH